MAKSLTRILEEGLAPEGRRIVSDWRAQVIWLRSFFQGSSSEAAQARTLARTRALLNRMVENQELLVADEAVGLYQISSPYANKDPILDWEVLMEANPYCVVAFHSAMTFHRITEDFPTNLQVMIPSVPDWLPVGLTDVDLEMQASIPAHSRRPSPLRGVFVDWHLIKHTKGIREYHTFTYPIRVTTLERTLLDGLAHPEWCGGLESVFRCWAKALDLIKIPVLVDLVEEIDRPLLRQRAGFVMETLGLSHPNLEGWIKKSVAGGSSRLLGTAPFQREGFSERWKLSINAPISTLLESHR